MRYVRARSGSELSSGATESVRNDDVSGVSQAAAREIRGRNHARYMHGRDTNMRQCDKVLAVDALGGISVAEASQKINSKALGLEPLAAFPEIC